MQKKQRIDNFTLRMQYFYNVQAVLDICLLLFSILFFFFFAELTVICCECTVLYHKSLRVKYIGH